MSDTTAPPVRVEFERGEVVIGPWPDYQGDYTALKVCDLDAFIASLIALRPVVVTVDGGPHFEGQAVIQTAEGP